MDGMTKLIINDHEVITNWEEGRGDYSYPMCNGEDRKGWIMYLPECREITKHDAQLEGIIKRCSFGSKAYNRNLQALFNYQA